MAKTYKNLYPKIYDFDNLYAAYKKARKGKRDRPEVQRFERDLEGNLIQIQNELIWGTYETGRYRNFKVFEPKERLVAALPFKDRVVQHALVSIIEPIWEARFIDDSYACRPGRGTHRGADKAESYLRIVKRNRGNACVLKADIAKYFYSIDHAILKVLIRKRIGCKRTLVLFDSIIDSTMRVGTGLPVGLPIGNLTSQLCANIYLHELDEFVKYQLRERYYVRYMDDFVIIHHDKEHLHRTREIIEDFLWGSLRLKTNAKTQVFPIAIVRGRPLDFLGYRIWTTHRKIRKSSIRRITRTLKRLRAWYAKGTVDLEKVSQSVVSWLGHASHAKSRGLQQKILGGFAFQRGPDYVPLPLDER